jgi:hypothetical protein
VIAEVRPGVAPTSTDRTKPDDIGLGGDPPRQDFERLALAAAFEEHLSDVDAAELPSFRPLVRGVPSPHPAPPTPRSGRPSAETSPATTVPLPFNRARALAAGQAPLQATSSRRGLRSRRLARRSAGPFVLVCLFLAGAVAGLGGAYVAGAEGMVDGAVQRARTVLTSLSGTLASPEIQTTGRPEAARSALAAAAGDSAPAAAGIAGKSGSDEQARASEERDQAASTAGSLAIGALPQTADVPVLSPGGAAAEIESDGVHATATMPSSITDRSPATASFALTRGDEAMKQRDVIAARRLYEFAASAGVAGAATAVARTYDPLYLRQVGVRGVQGDAETALRWYKRAWQEADTEARTR